MIKIAEALKKVRPMRWLKTMQYSSNYEASHSHPTRITMSLSRHGYVTTSLIDPHLQTVHFPKFLELFVILLIVRPSDLPPCAYPELLVPMNVVIPNVTLSP